MVLKRVHALTTGRTNTIVGSSAGSTMTTTNSNTIVGNDAASSTSGFSNGCYFGNSVVATANATNEIVIGGTASGSGSNTVTLGNTSITNTYLKGTVQCSDLAITGNITLPPTVSAAPTAGTIRICYVTRKCNLQTLTSGYYTTPCSVHLPIGTWLVFG